jgi:hypothetical protein
VKVTAQSGDHVFLVEVGDGKARVVDLRARYVGPAMNAIAIASRGGWDIFDGGEEREREILAAMREIPPAEPRPSPARV